MPGNDSYFKSAAGRQAPVKVFSGPRLSEEKKTADPAKLIVGWRAIAEYLGVSTHTAIKWHKVYGLPVIRIMRRKVVIHRDALIEWWMRLDRIQREMLEEIQGKLDPDKKRPARQTWVKWQRRQGELKAKREYPEERIH